MQIYIENKAYFSQKKQINHFIEKLKIKILLDKSYNNRR